MRLSRFYSERENLTIGSSVKLPDSEISHIRKALRLVKGDKIILFNGEKEFLAELTIVSKDIVKAKILELLRKADFSEEGGIEITLFQGLLRAGKMDLILKKTTELGISSIVPVECEYSQSKADKLIYKVDRWNKITIAASKQSGRIKIPEVKVPVLFQDVIAQANNFDIFYLFTIPNSKQSKGIVVKKLQKEPLSDIHNIAYFIGPEGGFSPNEYKLAKDAGMEICSFTDSVLTSENAAISALAILKFIYIN
jgi:16S rRNA (uracil1498-N3)-methyltransferase